MIKKEKDGKTNIKSFKKKVNVLVFLFAFILLIFILLIIYFSKIQIQIINFRFSSTIKRHINKDYKFIIKWYIFNKVQVMKLRITKTKIDKMQFKNKMEKMNLKKLKEQNKYEKKALKAVKILDIQIKKINLNIDIGTENAALTSMIVPLLGTIISIVLKNKSKSKEDHIFIINPIYLNQNIINISLSGIFDLKIRHIIYIIYMLNKKEGVRKYERTSDRRTYDYSYE